MANTDTYPMGPSGRVTVDQLERLARLSGLTVTTYAPGDGVRRYRFAIEGSPGSDNYLAARPLATVLGRRDALMWLDGYSSGVAVERGLVRPD